VGSGIADWYRKVLVSVVVLGTVLVVGTLGGFDTTVVVPPLLPAPVGSAMIMFLSLIYPFLKRRILQ
jgi:hypothetical protein